MRKAKQQSNEDEGIIWSWLNKQNILYKNGTHGMKNDERYDVWCKFIEQYKEYDIYNDYNDVWNTNFDKLKEFLDTENPHLSRKMWM